MPLKTLPQHSLSASNLQAGLCTFAGPVEAAQSISIDMTQKTKAKMDHQSDKPTAAAAETAPAAAASRPGAAADQSKTTRRRRGRPPGSRSSARDAPSTAAASPQTSTLPSWNETQAASVLASLSSPPTHPPAPRPTPSSAAAKKRTKTRPHPTPLLDDEVTARAIRAAQNLYSTRLRSPQPQQDMSASPAASSPLPPPPTATSAPQSKASPAPVAPPTLTQKKRPTPKNASKAGKNGDDAPKKPKSRKRKAGDDPGKKKGGNKKSQSGTPMTGVSPDPEELDDDDDDESVEDENAIYCICRKPDNHTWMIGCDGGCDDWYHGKCVNMRQEDEPLLDKFICPVCAEAQPGKVTTWKPMCRLDGCRNPARLKKGSESKYCSDACGKDFMKLMVQQSGGLGHARGKKAKPADDSDVGPLGGPISASELKTLVSATNDALSFRGLGDLAPLTPPDSNAGQSPVQTAMDVEDASLAPAYEPYELSRLDEIATRKAHLYERRMMLKARQKFVMMTRDRVQRMKQTTKDVCGYDSRLALDEHAFHGWARSERGRSVMESDALADPPAATDTSPGTAEDSSSVCQRKKCKKHADWQKISLIDVRFDEAEVGDEMRQIDAEETDLKQAGVVRARKRRAGVDGDEGHVEALDDEVMAV